VVEESGRDYPGTQADQSRQQEVHGKSGNGKEMRAGGEHMNLPVFSSQVDFSETESLFGQHHSVISKIIDDFSAEDSSVVLSIESGSLRAAANRRA
jgi:hypothetical protein